MAERRFSFILLLLISACSQATQRSETKVTIENSLSSCLKIQDEKIVYKNDFPVLNASFTTLSSTSECGCKSKISAYTSELQIGNIRSKLMEAKYVFVNGKELNIPVATSKQLVGDYGLVVKFSCGLPDLNANKEFKRN
ncbi:DUF2195 family protein [Teredinibacter haidensis]|uniref:DUF2195 family protein n=1 Tax=Teredinibacter haidensis TaxID=2731755 RepID=UPI000948E60F|nr:DUF2195 family protein [Teredinibacter haidensis]